MPVARSLKRLPGNGCNLFISELPGIEVIRTWNYQIENTRISQEIISLIDTIPSLLDYDQLFRQASFCQERLKLLLVLIIFQRIQQDQQISYRHSHSQSPYHVSQIRNSFINALIVLIKSEAHNYHGLHSSGFDSSSITRLFDKPTLKKLLGVTHISSSNVWVKILNRIKIAEVPLTADFFEWDSQVRFENKLSETSSSTSSDLRMDLHNSKTKPDVLSNSHFINVKVSSALTSPQSNSNLIRTIDPPLDFLTINFFATFFHKVILSPSSRYVNPISSLNPRWFDLTSYYISSFQLYQREQLQMNPRRATRKARSLHKTLLKNNFKVAFKQYRKQQDAYEYS